MKLTKKSLGFLVIALLLWLVSAILSDVAPEYSATASLFGIAGGFFGMFFLFGSEF